MTAGASANAKANARATAVDVAIVGGGIVGVATAWFLAARGSGGGAGSGGAPSIALIERGSDLGGGATGRPPGVLFVGLEDHYNRVARGVGRARAAEIWRASIENARLVHEAAARLGIECGHEPSGTYALATFKAEAEDLEESFALMREDGIAAEAGATFLSKEALAREPLAPRGLAAIRFDAGGALDGAALVRGLAARLGDRVEVLRATEVRAVEAAAGEARLDTPRGEIRASICVIATHAEAPRAHRFFEGRIWPVRGQGFVTQPTARALARPVTASWGHEHYRQLPGGRFVAAGVRPDPAADEITVEEGVTETFQGFLRKFAAHRVPAIDPDVAIEARFSAIAAFTQDGLPIVGPLPGVPALIAACGFAMRGLSFGMAVGKALAALVAEGRREVPAAFAPLRFL